MAISFRATSQVNQDPSLRVYLLRHMMDAFGGEGGGGLNYLVK
jgi:hypothetical protein